VLFHTCRYVLWQQDHIDKMAFITANVQRRPVRLVEVAAVNTSSRSMKRRNSITARALVMKARPDSSGET